MKSNVPKTQDKIYGLDIMLDSNGKKLEVNDWVHVRSENNHLNCSLYNVVNGVGRVVGILPYPEFGPDKRRLAEVIINGTFELCHSSELTKFSDEETMLILLERGYEESVEYVDYLNVRQWGRQYWDTASSGIYAGIARS